MNVLHNQSSNQDLLCCRACLATDCKLYNIHENKLADAFSRISGTALLKDRLPQYLCTYCCCLLLKCASFRATCLAAQELLILNLINGELNTDSILRLHRPSHRINLTLSVVNVLEYVETPTIDIKQEQNDVVNTDEPAIDTSVKSEGNIDKGDGNLSETRINNVNLGVSNIDDDNLVVSSIDDNNIGVSSIDDDNIGVSSIDDDNIGVSSIAVDNIGVSSIADDNIGVSSIANEDPVDVHSNKQHAGSKKKRVTKKNIVQIYDNIAYNEENRLVVNKGQTIKTYKKKNGAIIKKKLIDIQGHSDKVNVKIAKNDDVSLGETSINDVSLGELRFYNVNLSEPHIDDINLSEPHIDDINLSEPHLNDTNFSEPHIDDINLSEPHIDDTNLSEPHIDDTNLSEPHIDDVNLSEPHIDDINLREPHIDDINLSEPLINVINLSEPQIDVLNLSEPHTDALNLNAPHTDVINLSEPHIDDAHIDIVDVQEIIKKADSKKQRANKKVKKDTVQSKDNIDNDEEGTCLNKVKPIKTYARKFLTASKENMIEIQGYSDLVNDKIDKDEAVIDLNEADLDKIKRKITVRYANPDLAEDESDIEDINEIKARMKIVDIERIVKKAVKKPKQIVKKKISDNAVKPVKRRRKKKRKFRGPENDYMPVFDFSKVERDLDVKIVTLSKQEELEEIAERKKSRNYTASQYKCEDCGRGFDVDTTYSNHRRRHSPSAGSESCSICSLRYKRPCERHLHEDMHRFKFICQACGEVTRCRSSAKAHHDIHKGRWFACKHCDKQFRKRQSCLTHVRLAHAAFNVACDICGETFVSDHGLLMHKKLTHPETTSQQFKCTTCSASFVSLDALNRHTDSGSHAGRPCEQCGESCASEDALRAHAGERHPSESHWCEECCASFSSGAAFDVHYRRKHLNERAATVRRAPKLGPPAPAARQGPRHTPRGQSMCEQCGHIAPCLAALRGHQNRHLAVKPYPCPHCPKAFPTKEARTWHIRRHTGEKPYKCPDCPMTFNMQGNRNRHHNVVHLRLHADATACHVCARVFTTRSSMRLHVDSVHNGQPWPRRNRKRKLAS